MSEIKVYRLNEFTKKVQKGRTLSALLCLHYMP